MRSHHITKESFVHIVLLIKSISDKKSDSLLKVHNRWKRRGRESEPGGNDKEVYENYQEFMYMHTLANAFK